MRVRPFATLQNDARRNDRTKDYKDIINKYDSKEALFYIDPPYIIREKFYADGFTLEDHYELAELLNQVEGKVMLSDNRSYPT